jgi:hypothetical protein
LTGQKQIYGGMFKDELDAAKKVNELCKNFGVTQKNPSVSAVPNQQYQVAQCFVFHRITHKSKRYQTFLF